MEEIKAAVDPQTAVEQLGCGIARRESFLRSRSHDSGLCRKPGRTKLVDEGLRGRPAGIRQWVGVVWSVLWLCGAGAQLRLKGINACAEDQAMDESSQKGSLCDDDETQEGLI